MNLILNLIHQTRNLTKKPLKPALTDEDFELKCMIQKLVVDTFSDSDAAFSASIKIPGRALTIDYEIKASESFMEELSDSIYKTCKEQNLTHAESVHYMQKLTWDSII